jgi:branched-chain amino acid transport system substrate-binding protein
MESKKKDSYRPTKINTDANSETNPLANTMNDKLTRRQAISRMGWAGVGVAAVVIVGVGGYLAYEASQPSTTTTTSSQSSSTSSSSSSTLVTSSSPTGPTQVKLGAVISLTGPFAAFGQGTQFGHQQAINDINNQGGVNLGGNKVPITYKVYDDGSDPTKASSLASQIILSDQVDALVGSIAPPDTQNPISIAADRYSVPLMGTTGPWEPWWAGGPYKYSWSIGFRIVTEPSSTLWTAGTRDGVTGATAADTFLGVSNHYKSQMNGNAAVLTCGDTDGTGWYGALPPFLGKNGFNVVSPQLYPVGTTDFSSIITAWKNASCDLIWANLPAPDFGTFWRQADELGYRPKLAVIGRAPLFYTDVDAWGDNLPLDVCTEVWWDPTWGYKGIGSTTSQSLAAAWTSSKNQPLNPAIGPAYSCMQIMNDAMSRAGSLDKNAVNTAIGQTQGNFMMGSIKMLPDTHDSPCFETVGQWQAGTGSQPNWVLPVTWSNVQQAPTEATLIFPLPPWS